MNPTDKADPSRGYRYKPDGKSTGNFAMIDLMKKVLARQFEAALCMLNQCVQQCPVEQWDGKIGNDTFRQVTYHTLFWTDYYLSANENSFISRDLHRRGGDEFLPTPSAGLSREESLDYVAVCHKKVTESFAAETEESLQGPSGFSRWQFSRAELHVHNLRHLQHHTGQLSAFLRKVNLGADWVSSGWK